MLLKKSRGFIGTLVMVIVSIAFTSCYFDKEELLYGQSECTPMDVRFEQHILPIVQNSCAVVGCHVQGGLAPGIFENYTQIKDAVDRGSFQQRVLVNRDMPPSSPLSNCQLDFIRAWIEEGALNN